MEVTVMEFDYAGGHKGHRVVRMPNNASIFHGTFAAYDFTVDEVRRFDTAKIRNAKRVDNVSVIDTKVLPKHLNYAQRLVKELQTEGKVAHCDTDGVIVAFVQPKEPKLTITSRSGKDYQAGYHFQGPGGYVVLRQHTCGTPMILEGDSVDIENPTADQFFNALKKVFYG